IPQKNGAQIHPLKFAGETSADKCARLGSELAQQNIEAEFINDPTLVAWLLNIRGRDVPHIPVVHARAMLHASGRAELFIDPRKLNIPLDPHIDVRDPDDMAQSISSLQGKTIRLPANNTPYAILQMAQDANIKTDTAPSGIMLARAIKNPIEQNGMRNAHRRDAIALAKAFKEFPSLVANELQIAQQVASHRSHHEHYVEESFPAIVGWRGNSAIVHYRPDDKNSAKISGSGILLIDSGGQYLDGTTDVTRTITIGTPTAWQKEIYTRVLKGHLAISRAQFPIGTTGSQLDTLARQYLWEVGLDYDHGTGHGVGSFLSVHEGPQSISNRANSTALVPGMVLSNEPGCYIENEFGVRIENLVMVTPSAQTGFLCFETLTFVAYDENLIEKSLLTEAELEQIKIYHQRVQQIIQ
ncbi:MAG TPA: aminopeptidase family protein P, partial [Alphaproteobacteria bacterium]|nr:aminopeptidase family protein P [Alphaproteobacteria bacterium]